MCYGCMTTEPKTNLIPQIVGLNLMAVGAVMVSPGLFVVSLGALVALVATRM